MPKGMPQNPVFRVDPMALECCRPKVVCANCGTVMRLARKPAPHVRCPGCGKFLAVRQESGKWKSFIWEEAQPEEEKNPPDS